MPRLRLFLCLSMLLALTACARPAAVIAPPPPPLPLDANAACLQDLNAMRISYQLVEPFGEPDQGCGINNPVKVSAAAISWSRPGLISCDMARTVGRYESEIVQPLAQKYFGQPVAKVHHAGTYDCRARRTSSNPTAQSMSGSKGGRLSEHSKGQAIDITAFQLADGTMVSVKNDWRGQSSKSAFLRDVGRASCRAFNVVLTPNHDKLHQDHLHLDIGPYTLCGN